VYVIIIATKGIGC